MKKSPLRNERGFTLIEIIAVLVILGILAAVAIPKYIDMRQDAVKKAVKGLEAELNARERLTLAKWKLDSAKDQSTHYDSPDYYVGKDFKPVAGSGGTIGTIAAPTDSWTYESMTVTCTRATTKEADGTDSVNAPDNWTCTAS